MKADRLDKIITSTGRYTRSEAKPIIRSGRVKVDGNIIKTPEYKADPFSAKVEIDGEPLIYKQFYHIMMNKPAGVISATEDRKEKTALDLLPEELRRQGLFPAGRLDKDAEGFLLLTNDGELAHSLMSPKRHVDKVYYLRIEGALNELDCAQFAKGITIDDGYECMPANLEIISTGNISEAYVTVREGKFHQVKRMIAACGKNVIYLKRMSIAGVQLDLNLGAGEFRQLTLDEEAEFYINKI